MARRTLRNLDERILKKTVLYGALKGVARVSTKKIASVLTITEPTIYVHFKTKVNLLYQAYLYAARAVLAGEGTDNRERISTLIDNVRLYPEAGIYVAGYRHYEKNAFDKEHPDPVLESIKAQLAPMETKGGASKDDMAYLLADILGTIALVTAQDGSKINEQSLDWLLTFLESGAKAALGLD